MFTKRVVQGVFISLLIGGCSVKELPKESSEDKPVVLFILDSSESMKTLEDGKSKMYNAKKSVFETVKKMDKEKFNTALITYDNVRRCRAKAEVELGNPTNILNRIEDIEAWGVSPLADAIRLSNEMLSRSEKKMVILLSDGKDNCGGNPVEEAKKLYKKYGVKVNLQVIGYAVEEKKKEELRKIATISKDWMYHDTINIGSVEKVVEKIIQNIQPEQQMVNTNRVEDRPSFIKTDGITEYVDIEVSNFIFQFDTASNNLNITYLNKIEELNNYLKNNNKRILLIGHADSRGTESFNQKLSVSRAKAIKSKLIELGIESNKIEIKGDGEMNPIAPNDTNEGQRENRRVEIQILD
ncbi:OmpA family protein [Sulfurovum sp. bin170]|uniref:OmpA family protein n=1 Tax=Sulfurovum sp. bin170 TaxID=2695268 RepID=UPI0013DFA7D4|nr:OmpA family protein [Sulfurovum sp. bin170]NEW60056.1 OmpA family protein [Sulfurovum sp. bin170]